MQSGDPYAVQQDGIFVEFIIKIKTTYKRYWCTRVAAYSVVYAAADAAVFCFTLIFALDNLSGLSD